MKHSRSSLFLMEMILSLLFFSLSAIVCVQLFVYAHKLSIHTTNLNHAHLHAQNLAEAFLASKGELPSQQTWLADFRPSLTEDSLCLYFDRNWQPTEAKNAVFLAKLTLNPSLANENKGLKAAQIAVSSLEDGSDLYTLPLVYYPSHKEAGHE